MTGFVNTAEEKGAKWLGKPYQEEEEVGEEAVPAAAAVGVGEAAGAHEGEHPLNLL